MMRRAIRLLGEGGDLNAEEMKAAMHQIMCGDATPAQIGAFLLGLHVKGETVDEIAAAAAVMRELLEPIRTDCGTLVDTCGTGGDGAELFNISTTAALVAAAAGARVAKHGNRSVSSTSGSADVLEAAGVNLHLDAEQTAQCLHQIGVAFIYAPNYHKAMKHAIQPRKELGIRTIFNLLGPLTNPAGASCQVLGVFDARWLRPLAETLRHLGSQHVMVVHAEDGLDEFSLAAPTRIAELRAGAISEYSTWPEAVGLRSADLSPLRVKGVEDSLEKMLAVLDGEPGVAHDMVCLNAGAAIYVAGLEADLAAGVTRAAAAIRDGSALGKLQALVLFGEQAQCTR